MIRGIGLGSLLAIVFVTLRLCGVIAWPWVWVLAPWWIPTALVMVAFIVSVLFLRVVGGKK